MISFRHMTLLVTALGLSACVSGNDPATRSAMPPVSELVSAASQSAGSPVAGAALTETAEIRTLAQYDVEAIRVTVPRSLKVSEANTFKPRADIVWRGEALGDRYVQVQAIFEEAMKTGTESMQKGRKVILEIEVTRFHALTEKTRYTIGGKHEMRFALTVRDSTTGQVLDGPRNVVADIKASGGSAAIAEDQAGRTQHVVTVERLAQVIRHELSARTNDGLIVSRNATPALTAIQ